MEIRKSHWESNGDTVRLEVPFEKIDREKRLVSGWATLDNLDQHGDIVLAEASQKAFARFRGNIREMHQPIAAGRMVSFKEDEFYDSDTQKFYRGIFVTAYISKGSPNTWEKVLDGTLTGFSIGGKVLEKSHEYVADADRSVQFIKDYDLTELSLVDSPANQLANVFSIQKSAEGSVILKGMMAETMIENVFWCREHGIAKQTQSETASCSVCEKKMENIGWFEGGDDSAGKVRDVVNKFLGHTQEAALQKQAPANGEGGVDVADNVNEEVADASQTEGPHNEEVSPENQAAVDAAEVQERANTSDEVDEEEATPVDEVEPSDPDVAKAIDELKNSVNSGLEDVRKAATEAVGTVEKKVEEQQEAFIKEMANVKEHLDNLQKDLDGIKNTSESVAKRLASLEDETAIKKSGDVDSSDTVRKSADVGPWNGIFLDDISK